MPGREEERQNQSGPWMGFKIIRRRFVMSQALVRFSGENEGTSVVITDRMIPFGLRPEGPARSKPRSAVRLLERTLITKDKSCVCERREAKLFKNFQSWKFFT